jgi:hypothetical protein
MSQLNGPITQIRVHGETEVRSLTVKTGVYQLAAVAAPAVFGLELPVDLEIWVDDLLPEYGPYHYRVEMNEFVCVQVKHLVQTHS